MSKQVEVSRRAVLAGLSTVGLATLGAGFGTRAFGDAAGTSADRSNGSGFDLDIDWNWTYDGPAGTMATDTAPNPGDHGQSVDRDGQSVDDGSSTDGSGTSAGGGSAAETATGTRIGPMRLVDIADAEPGDSGEATFTLRLSDAGRVWMDFFDLVESGGPTPEPERAELGSDADEGELSEAVAVTLWYDERLVFEGTLAALFEAAGDPLSDGDHVGRRVPLDGDYVPAGESRRIRFGWSIPTRVGNVIQGDTAAFDVGFYAEACRPDGSGSASPE